MNKTEIKRIFDLQSEPTNIVRLRNSPYIERIENKTIAKLYIE